jgi:hypothetical protein
LRDEYDFSGGYSSVKEYVREKKLGGQEMFVPLVHPPGDAQADFGEALVVIDEVGYNVGMFDGKHFARAREARLNFIRNQNDLVLVAQPAQPAHELEWRHVETAFAQHRLDNDGRDLAGIKI